MTIDEYARAVAEAVRAHCEQEARDWDDRAGQAIGNVIAGIRLDAIIASVPKPEAQHHDAPTCDDYAMAIAEAVHDATMRHVACRHRDTFVVFDCPLDLDAIIASVPRPTAQHHVAPDVHPTGYPATVENIYNDPALNMARHQGRIEGWRRALNERPDMQALLEEEMRLRDKACAAHQAAAYARGKSDVQAQIDAAVAREREKWMADRQRLKAALARPCISCGYKSKQIVSARSAKGV